VVRVEWHANLARLAARGAVKDKFSVADRRTEKWSLTREAFDALLESLDSDRDRAGQIYQDIRDHLIRMFVWRGCSLAEEYADETINRVARKLTTGEHPSDLPTYFFGVARMLLKEFHKEQERDRRALQELPHQLNAATFSEEQELRISCLERCLQKQTESARHTVLAYYQGDKREKIENRKRLAKQLNVSLNTLRMQALRLRERLESCVLLCLAGRHS
jgi:DNA-directed RNA polymerase specialized sigma24 family protein